MLSPRIICGSRTCSPASNLALARRRGAEKRKSGGAWPGPFFCRRNFCRKAQLNHSKTFATMGKKSFRVRTPRPLTRQLRSADMTRHTGKEQERRRRRPRRRAGRRWLERLSRHPQGEREAPALLRHLAPAPRGGEECLLGGSQTRAPQQLQVLRFQRVRLTCRGVANCLLTLIATQSRPHRQGPPSDQIHPRDR